MKCMRCNCFIPQRVLMPGSDRPLWVCHSSGGWSVAGQPAQQQQQQHQQQNALSKASLESDDGGLPVFSDSAAQRLEPAELPNPKCA